MFSYIILLGSLVIEAFEKKKKVNIEIGEGYYASSVLSVGVFEHKIK